MGKQIYISGVTYMWKFTVWRVSNGDDHFHVFALDGASKASSLFRTHCKSSWLKINVTNNEHKIYAISDSSPFPVLSKVDSRMSVAFRYTQDMWSAFQLKHNIFWYSKNTKENAITYEKVHYALFEFYGLMKTTLSVFSLTLIYSSPFTVTVQLH